MFRAALRSLFAHKVRLLLTGISIVLGVGFMAGTYVLTDTMTSSFNDLIEGGTADVDLFVRSENAFTGQMANGGMEERRPLPESVLADVEAVPGVERAIGDVLGFAQIVDPETGKVIGTFGPPTAASSWNDLSGFEIEPGGRPPEGSDEVVIDKNTAEGHDIAVGSRVQILFEGAPGEFEVVGVAGYGEGDSLMGATWALFDLATAQQVLGRQDQVDSITIVAEEGTSTAALQQNVAEVLPDGAEVITGATLAGEAQDQVSEGLGFFRTALLVFAFVALFVGAFIIFNTFAIIVAQRTRELALFRALGATARQVMTSVVAEAIVVGLVSSAVGVLAGIGIAMGLRALLNATGFDLPASGAVILPRTFVVSIIVGTVVTLVAAVVPARRAARVAPIEALREAQDRPGRSLRFRLVSGAAVLVLGLVPLLYGLFGTPDNALQLVGIGVAFTFIGVAMLTPMIARPVARALGAPIRRTGVPGKLGRENAMRNPRRTAATASALMIGLGLVVFVAVFGESAKASVTATLDRTLRADFVLTSPTFTGFSTTVAEEVREVEGVAAVAAERFTEIRLNGDSVFLDGIDVEPFGSVADVGDVQGSFAALNEPNTVAVLEREADDRGITVGQTLEVEFAATGTTELEVVAIFAEQGILDQMVVSMPTFEENVTQQLDTFVMVKAAEGVDVGALESQLAQALEPFSNVQVQDQAAFRDQFAQFLNQILNLLTGLLLMAVVIAAFGIVNTLSLSIYERTRELGLLRAVGLSRRQTKRMVRWEAVIISVMGAVFGVVIGIAFGWALQQALAPQGFDRLGIPGGQLTIYVALSALLGVAAAILPSRRAAKLNILESIAYE
ncbi:MAG TPA: ABC transporter permease [Actinomycetota bacterium]